jgi:hypothetical protein
MWAHLMGLAATPDSGAGLLAPIDSGAGGSLPATRQLRGYFLALRCAGGRFLISTQGEGDLYGWGPTTPDDLRLQAPLGCTRIFPLQRTQRRS